MLNRRSFLLASSSLILGQLLGSCAKNEQNNLKIRLLQQSIPTQLLGDFGKQKPEIKLKFKPETKLQDLFKLLQTWQQPPSDQTSQWDFLPFLGSKSSDLADLVTIGDSWLQAAIKEKLIEPLTLDKLSNWQQLPPSWQQLVKRNQQGELDANGQIWAAPYRWGCTMIVYNQKQFKKLGWQPTDWQDLWREQLRDRISLLNEPREVIGLTLKKLGYSYNSTDLSQISNLESELNALAQQVKFYDSTNYLQPLLLEDTWLAVGWSGDILPVIKRNPNLAAIVPNSGTSLWADLWVKPKNSQNQDLIAQWIDFCWQTKSAQQISLFSPAASPIILTMNPEQLSPDLRNNPLLAVKPEIMSNSEFILPLSAQSEQKYLKLWQKIRTSTIPN